MVDAEYQYSHSGGSLKTFWPIWESDPKVVL
jgi:hypothetical protein